jgi:hypothetical protein
MELDDRHRRWRHLQSVFHVYGLVWTEIGKVVYIGSTCNAHQRELQHLQFAIRPHKNTRVRTALRQARFQPRSRHFRFVGLWKGLCLGNELLAIEQYFHNKYDTRVIERPLDDHDLTGGGAPLQLNVIRASRDAYLISRVDAFLTQPSMDGADVQELIETSPLLKLERLCAATRDLWHTYMRESAELAAESEAKRQKLNADTKAKKQKLAAELEDAKSAAKKRAQDAESEARKSDIAFRLEFDKLKAKYAWATEQNNTQLAAHIEQLILDL